MHINDFREGYIFPRANTHHPSFTFDMHFQRNAINQIILNMNIYHPHGNYLCLHLAPWKGGKNEKKDKKHINFLSQMKTVSNLLKEKQSI